MSEHYLSQEEIDVLLRAERGSAAACGEAMAQLWEVALGTVQSGRTLAAWDVQVGRVDHQTLGWGVLRQELDALPEGWTALPIEWESGVGGYAVALCAVPDVVQLGMAVSAPSGTPAVEHDEEGARSAGVEWLQAFLQELAEAVAGVLGQEGTVAGLQPLALPQQLAEVTIRDDESVVELRHAVGVGDRQLELSYIVPLEIAQAWVSLLERGRNQPAAPAERSNRDPVVPPAATPPREGAADGPTADRSAGRTAVHPAEFAPLRVGRPALDTANIGLILDVPLKVTVELGRTRLLIREILELGRGSVIELEKLAGEPVDILVNGKLLAKGEVVVIDENFGVKITDIVSPAERIKDLQ